MHFHKIFPDTPCIAIVALSGCAPVDTNVDVGLQALGAAGFRVINYYEHDQRFQRFGASDAKRVQQFHAALDNPEVDMIMALRGSYGLSRILPMINFDKIAQSGKLLIGYSDFNALQLAMLAKINTASLCGPMLYNDFTRPHLRPYTQEQFLRNIRERRTDVQFETDAGTNLDVAGTLWGGNLAMLVHLFGTEYFPNIHGGILFIEDVAEHPYRVERMLLQLHFAGILERQKAIIFGDFSAYQLSLQDNGYDFDAMIAYLRKTITTPILTGLPFGHCDDKASLMQGAKARLHVSGINAMLTANY
jgi:muramoyltetrapeptide carboxypeptidase